MRSQPKRATLLLPRLPKHEFARASHRARSLVPASFARTLPARVAASRLNSVCVYGRRASSACGASSSGSAPVVECVAALIALTSRALETNWKSAKPSNRTA
eukprot:6176902-Pleurochrysis_carterae.AAC.4